MIICQYYVYHYLESWWCPKTVSALYITSILSIYSFLSLYLHVHIQLCLVFRVSIYLHVYCFVFSIPLSHSPSVSRQSFSRQSCVKLVHYISWCLDHGSCASGAGLENSNDSVWAQHWVVRLLEWVRTPPEVGVECRLCYVIWFENHLTVRHENIVPTFVQD